MASNNPPPPGSIPPPKPWERAGSSSGPTPFKPSVPGNTSDVVEASGTARPGEVVSTTNKSTAVTGNTQTRPVPNRPWMQQPYGGYGTGLFGSYGGYGGAYGGGLYGNNMYRGGYGGGLFGGGMYNSGLGGPMGGYGMGMGGAPNGGQDPNNPSDAPSPPGFWISLVRVMQGFVTFVGRIALLIDQNTQAFHLFITALLQLFDRSGLLYVELAGFVFRLLGIGRKNKKVHPPGPSDVPGQSNVEGPKAASTSAWDSVWGEKSK